MSDYPRYEIRVPLAVSPLDPDPQFSTVVGFAESLDFAAKLAAEEDARGAFVFDTLLWVEVVPVVREGPGDGPCAQCGRPAARWTAEGMTGTVEACEQCAPEVAATEKRSQS